MRSAAVCRGGNALPFGSSTLGGAINFVTPAAQTAFAPNILRFDGGSFGTWRANAQVSRVPNDVDVMVNGTVSHSEGLRQHAHRRAADLGSGWDRDRDAEAGMAAGNHRRATGRTCDGGRDHAARP